MDKKDIVEMAKVIAKSTPSAIDLKIPDGITEIKDYAYWNGTDLRTISIPASVTKIGAYAFAGCVGLQRFFVDPGNRHFYLTFLEGESFEDVIRTAVSLGGDCDTLTCIAGAIAEGFYGVPEELKAECRKRLDQKMAEILRRFDEYILFQKQMMEMD